MIVSVDIRDYIVDYYLSLTTPIDYDSQAFVNSMPPLMNECLCFYDDGGIPDDHVFNDQGNIENKFLKVIVRSMDMSTAYNLLEDISDILEHKVINETINGTYYLQCHHKSQILSLGLDSKSRYEFSCNFLVNVQIWINK